MDKKSKNKKEIDIKNIKERFFSQLLVISLITSILNIVANLLIKFPIAANIKWIILAILSFIFIKLDFIKIRKSELLKFIYFMFVIFIFLPLGWYDSGADSYNVILYAFLLIVASCFLFTSWRRFVLVISPALIYSILLYIQTYHKHLLYTLNNTRLQFLDNIVQVWIVIFIAYLMLRHFSNTFHQKNEMLELLNTKLANMAYHDSLTGLYNRAFIFDKFDDLLKSNSNFTTIMLDIDNFKLINDTYGHLVGDQIITSVSRVLTKIFFNSSAYVGRYGGDEFIIILTDYDYNLKEKFILLKNKIRNYSKIENFEITFSGGYLKYESHLTLDEHLRLVDELLYKAKNSGKDQLLSS